MLFTLFTLDDCLRADPFNKFITHIRQSRVTIHLTVLLHLYNTVLHQIQFVVRKRQSLYDILVSLHNLCGSKPGRHPDSLGMILHLMADRMNTAVHRPLLAKIRHLGIDPFRGYFLDGGYQIFHTLIFHRTDGNHRNPQCLFHLCNINGAAVSTYLIHHIEG